VVRELADVQRTILGPWRKPLGAETMVAADETSHCSSTAPVSSRASSMPISRAARVKPTR
jgi:hypothetical protein